LEAVKASFDALRALGFNPEQIIQMVSHDGGSKNLGAVEAFYSRLLVKGWSLIEITENVSKAGGSGALLRLLDSGGGVI